MTELCKKRVTLNDLIRFGRPPLSEHNLLESARFTQEEIPIRLAHRIDSLRNLPFIVVRNPIYSLYLRSFNNLLSQPRVENLQQNENLSKFLLDVVRDHSNTIPTLALGFRECREYIQPHEMTSFLDTHLRARIATRMIAEQHVALHQPFSVNMIGIVDTQLSPKRLITQCADFVGEICEIKYGQKPEIRVIGDQTATFAYLPVHFEYIFTELLKNSFRATAEAHKGNYDLPEVEVTLATSSARRMTIRIRDRGGGIDPSDLPYIWDYSFTTFKDGTEEEGLTFLTNTSNQASSIAGLGYGLPLSRAYLEFFGGGIAIESCFGWGTDVYVEIAGLDTTSIDTA